MNENKLTLAELMSRAEQRSNKENLRKLVPLPGLGGALEIEKVPLSRILDIMDGTNADSMRDNMDCQVELIYTCCPMMRETSLQEVCQCNDPMDVVYKVLDDNMGDIALLADAILNFYGLGEVDCVKN